MARMLRHAHFVSNETSNSLLGLRWIVRSRRR